MFNDLLQALAASAAVFVQAVAVGAFQYQNVGTLRWHAGPEDRCAWCAEVAGEDYSLAGLARAVLQIDLYIRRAEHMGGALQTHFGLQAFIVLQGKPVIVGQRDDALLHLLEVTVDLFLVSAEGELESIFQHDGQQFGRRLAAHDRAIETSGQ